jgi:conjugal transfer mating pair stabilization protein TraN
MIDRVSIITNTIVKTILFFVVVQFYANYSLASAVSQTTKYTEGAKIKFTPSYRTHDGKTGQVRCRDDYKVCQDSNTEKIVAGVKVTRPCWKYGYGKVCEVYPSKNDCGQWRHCYIVADRECLTFDSYNNCVNIKKEFSCKRWEPNYVNKDKIRYGKEDKQGVETIVCKGVPCIDGNCVDKSFDSNNEMLDSVARLYAISQMKGVTDMNFQVFKGYAAHCVKKPTDYSNCCKLNGGANNWGHHLGANCSKDEKTLIEERKKNLCVYVGKSSSAKILKISKHHWCCFGNMLTKVLQVEGRKQLGLNFGSGGNPDCRGLTFAEILRLDFDRMDFSEFEAEILKKMKMPTTNDLEGRVRGAFPNMQSPRDERSVSPNSRDGVNNSFIDG